MIRTLTEIMQDELNLTNPIIDHEWDSLDNDSITQYCQYMDDDVENLA